jgi:hypothetical protein
MNKKYNITTLINPNFIPYSLTIALKQNATEYDNYPDSLIYTDAKYININQEVQKQVDQRVKQVLKSFRLGLNKWNSHFLETSNITRTSYINKTPIIHYTVELMNKYERRNMVADNKGGIGICPLHFHGIVFVKSYLNDRFFRYEGDDKLLDYSDRFLSSRIKRLETEQDVYKWNDYINKSSDSYYYPFSDFYPISYKENPDKFIESSLIN